MKKCNALRNRLLPIVAIVAMTFIGSCSKDALMEPDGTNAALQTRATPELTISCTPEAKGEGKNLLSLKETYRFVGTAGIMNGFGLVRNEVCPLNFRAADGSVADLEVSEGSNMFGEYYDVKFTSPGYYYVTLEYTNAEGTLYKQTWTYCVVSRAESVTLPETIKLGVPFDLKFQFEDTRYPAPTLDVAESLFNNPQYTVLSNDGHGSIRMRIDQPGEYLISTGLGGKFSACANIKLYWRPENVSCENLQVTDPSTGVSFCKNKIRLLKKSEFIFPMLYRAFFDYKLYKYVNGQSLEVEGVSGRKFCGKGSDGIVDMPNTEFVVPQVRLSWALTRVIGHYWCLTIPDDEIRWYCVVDPDVAGPFEPENPGGIIGPLDPPGGTIIK